MSDREISPSGLEFPSLVPGRNSDPLGEISLSYMDTHDGLLYSSTAGMGVPSEARADHHELFEDDRNAYKLF